MSTPGHQIVPESLLRRFADDTGRVMIERRDRGRRRLADLGEAAAAGGVYTVAEGARAAALARLLAETDLGAADAIDRILAGAFPPARADRTHLALFVAVRLLLGRAQRQAFTETVSILGEVAAASLPEGFDADDVPAEPDAALAAVDVIVHDDQPHGVSLAAAPHLARGLVARTWQLVRFPRPQLLTGDMPAVAWSPSRGPQPTATRPGAAAEVRVPLDPRHALILASAAPSGQIVRDLADRHASALNRTVAEAARTWIYYHPAADPLGGVLLDPP